MRCNAFMTAAPRTTAGRTDDTTTAPTARDDTATDLSGACSAQATIAPRKKDGRRKEGWEG